MNTNTNTNKPTGTDFIKYLQEKNNPPVAVAVAVVAPVALDPHAELLAMMENIPDYDNPSAVEAVEFGEGEYEYEGEKQLSMSEPCMLTHDVYAEYLDDAPVAGAVETPVVAPVVDQHAELLEIMGNVPEYDDPEQSATVAPVVTPVVEPVVAADRAQKMSPDEAKEILRTEFKPFSPSKNNPPFKPTSEPKTYIPKNKPSENSPQKIQAAVAAPASEFSLVEAFKALFELLFKAIGIKTGDEKKRIDEMRGKLDEKDHEAFDKQVTLLSEIKRDSAPALTQDDVIRAQNAPAHVQQHQEVSAPTM